MIRSFLATLLSLLFFVTNAQQAPIAIVSASGTTRLTSTLDSAAILAQDNDIIYLPGGTFTGNTTKNFEKKVTVIGVGHNPDSTSATGRTEIIGNIGFYIGSEGSTLEGCYVSGGNVYITRDLKIYRCNVAYINSASGWPTALNILVDKCVIRNGIYADNNTIQNSKIKNSIIASGVNFTQNVYYTTYENNVFLENGSYNAMGNYQSTYKNNIFLSITGWTATATNNIFYNNVFGIVGYPPLTDSSNAINNIVNQTIANTFSPTPTLPTSTYSYNCDYSINPTNTQILTGGTGGTQIGIYGGTSPWVKGNIPPNPHIRTKNVAATTGAGGTLRVQFNVGVQ